MDGLKKVLGVYAEEAGYKTMPALSWTQQKSG